MIAPVLETILRILLIVSICAWYWAKSPSPKVEGVITFALFFGILMVAFWLRQRVRKRVPDERDVYLAYVSSHLSLIATLIAAFVIAAIEYLQKASVGVWFLVIPTVIAVSRICFYLYLRFVGK